MLEIHHLVRFILGAGDPPWHAATRPGPILAWMAFLGQSAEGNLRSFPAENEQNRLQGRSTHQKLGLWVLTHSHPAMGH